MARLAVVGKQATLGEPPPGTHATHGGSDAPVGVVDFGTHVVLHRHGLDAYVPPHRIDHAANMRALADLGCDRVLAIGSAGSLRRDLPVGSFVLLDDFIGLDQAPVVASANQPHVVAGFTPRWRAAVLDAWRAEIEEPVVDGGVYWQTNGPRFETPAEIRLLAQFADVVGMTVASECTAACQLGLDYAVVCIVDNLANGIGEAPLTPDDHERGQESNQRRLAAALGALVPVLVS